MDIKVVTHYPVSDPECHGDYWDIEMFIEGDLFLEFGDDYHNKGQAQVEGVLAFLDASEIEYRLEEEQVADR